MNIAIRCIIVGLMTELLPMTVANAQNSIAIPGAPKGDLKTELLQSRTYCRSMEKQLEVVEKQFPSLSIEVLAASASWKSSPFAIGCNTIEAQMIEQAGEKATTMLRELDSKTWKEAQKHIGIKTEAEARDFLTLVDRRAKGAIEVEMVRGNLLWNHKPFQESPEKECALGYSREVAHTFTGSFKVTFQIPMSWKVEDSPKTELMSLRNCFGHGNVWMTVLVSPLVDAYNHPVSAQERFNSYSEESLRTEYEPLGIKLNSFTKTKVNSMPALMFTRDQLYEQLGEKATRSAEVIRIFANDHSISFQINTLGPEGEPTAATRIEKNQKLFNLIGGSVRVTPK